ncbi:MAG TPA: hypothetical protein VF832_04925, partial [Longimicrobiales bacterium]
MRGFTEYFKRIQGRLVLAFGIVITGTIVIWWFGMMSMSQLTDEIGLRMDQLHKSLDLGSQLEATVLNQMVYGEHYVSTGDTASRQSFQVQGRSAHELISNYTKLPGFTEGDRHDLVRIAELQVRIEGQYARAAEDRHAGRGAASGARLDSIQASAPELKALLRAVNSNQATRVETAARQVESEGMRREIALLV